MPFTRLRSWDALIRSLVFVTCGCVSTAQDTSSFATAEAALQDVSSHEQQSRKQILEANRLRKVIAGLHVEKRKAKDPARRTELNASVAAMTAQMESLQQKGAELRLAALSAKAVAVDHYQQAMIGKWAEWIKSQQPLGLAGQALSARSRAHNPKIASADPSVIRRQAAITAAEDQNNSTATSSLLAATLKEQNAPADLDLGVFQLSRERTMIGHIEVATKDSATATVPINEIHEWRLVVSDTQGNPVDAEFKVIGHMPGHVHGLPTQPAVTQKLAPGVYLVEGLKFQMRGWWVMEFDSGPDRIRFNIVL